MSSQPTSIDIALPNGSRLTNQTPAGVLVLLWDNMRMGPADALPANRVPPTYGGLANKAGTYLADWGSQAGRTEEEFQAAKSFCERWPAGPQPQRRPRRA
jgi:hypothetical protein